MFFWAERINQPVFKNFFKAGCIDRFFGGFFSFFILFRPVFLVERTVAGFSFDIFRIIFFGEIILKITFKLLGGESGTI